MHYFYQLLVLNWLSKIREKESIECGKMIFLKYLRLHLHLNLSLNDQMVIHKQNSHQITIHQIWITLVKWPNGNSETKHSSNYHLAIQQLFLNGLQNSCWIAIQTQAQTQMELGVYEMHRKCIWALKPKSFWGPLSRHWTLAAMDHSAGATPLHYISRS